MQLTQALLDGYVGGQVEVQNNLEGYLYRGEIASAFLKGEGDQAELKFTLSWMAEGVGFPPLPSRWVKHPNLTYQISLLLYQPSLDDLGRLHLQSFITGELTVVFPPGGSRLDPTQVEGLALSSS